MKFYEATKDGLIYQAMIHYTDLGKGYAIEVTARPPFGVRYPDWQGKKQGCYASEDGAMKALRRHYPGMEWKEI